ncbi:MAG: hypothetical protein H6816_08230 [Phycisphaerales bacterium]|nr:hypothetical protein [Phycisphaerales bacterium]
MTLIETAVAVGLVGMLGVLAAGVSADMAEEARTAKCQSNLRQMITAIHAYTVDYGGTLPGPVHPTIRRGMYSLGPSQASSNDRVKTLAWLLRPYLPPVGPADSDPALPDATVDELMRCPTASLVIPDEQFDAVAGLQTGCWRERPYSYVINSTGPTSYFAGSSMQVSTVDWAWTDPPHYFGAWAYCHSSPTSLSGRVSWCPVRIDEVPNAGAEWATADAWYRWIGRDGGLGSRPGQGFVRPWMGTFDLRTFGSYAPLIPSAPYHRTALSAARSHYESGNPVLPKIDFDGETNMAYFDGHVAPFRGSWLTTGTGGTVNAYWKFSGGTHSSGTIWQPRDCSLQPRTPQ